MEEIPVIQIYLWGNLVGAMSWDDERGYADFQFDDRFRRSGLDIAPLMMDKTGQWSFAPAYDICYSYNPAGRWTSRHQLSLNSKTDDFTREDFLAVAKNIGIRDANHIIEEVRSSVASWPDTAKDCGVRPEHIEAISKTLLLRI